MSLGGQSPVQRGGNHHLDHGLGGDATTLEVFEGLPENVQVLTVEVNGCTVVGHDCSFVVVGSSSEVWHPVARSKGVTSPNVSCCFTSDWDHSLVHGHVNLRDGRCVVHRSFSVQELLVEVPLIHQLSKCCPRCCVAQHLSSADEAPAIFEMDTKSHPILHNNFFDLAT